MSGEQQSVNRGEFLPLVNGLNPKRSGKWVMFSCPVPGHGAGKGDKDRSAGLSEAGVLQCFAGCDFKALSAALRERGGARGGYRGESSAGRELARSRPSETAWIEVESYEYRDEHGTLIAVKRRREAPDPDSKKGYAKEFQWRLPKSQTWDGFKGQLKLEDVPLWGAELLPQSPDATVWITEGEKACKAARAAGLLAVCGGWGASQTTFGEGLLALQGRDVIIWPDNDKAGRDYSRVLRRALRGIARSVVVISAPVAPGEDAFEYFKRGGTVEALLAGTLTAPTTDVYAYDHFRVRIPAEGSTVSFEFRDIRTTRGEMKADLTVSVEGIGLETEPYNQEINLQSQSTRDGLRRMLEGQFGKEGLNWTTLISIAYARVKAAFEEADNAVQLMDLPSVGANSFLIDTFIPLFAPTVMFGRGGSLKSYVVAWFLLHVALGEELPGGHRVKQGNVMILDYEDPASWQERFRRLLLGMGLGGYDPDAFLGQLPIYFWKGDRGTPLESMRDALKRSLRRHDIDLLVVDSAMPACGGKPEDSDVTIQFFNSLHSFDVTSVVISHVSHAELENGARRPYGNVLWENQPRRLWSVMRDDDEDTDSIDIMLRCTKVNRGKKPPPQGFRFLFDGEDGPVTVEPITDVKSVAAFATGLGVPDQIRGALKRSKTPLTIAEIAEELAIPPNRYGSIRSALRRMPDVYPVGEQKGGRGQKATYALLAPGEKPPAPRANQADMFTTPCHRCGADSTGTNDTGQPVCEEHS